MKMPPTYWPVEKPVLNFFFWLWIQDKVSLCNSPGCPRTPWNLPVSASQVLGLTACAATTWPEFSWWKLAGPSSLWTVPPELVVLGAVRNWAEQVTTNKGISISPPLALYHILTSFRDGEWCGTPSGNNLFSPGHVFITATETLAKQVPCNN